MLRDELQAEITELQRAADRAAANLFELEQDARWTLIRSASLSGETERRRDEVSEELGALWADLSKLREFLDRAKAVRHPTRSAVEAELERLLRGPGIEVTERVREIGDRRLVDSARVHTVMTVDRFVARMSARFAMATSFVVEVAGRWDDLMPRVEHLGDALAQCAESGLAPLSEITPLRGRVESAATVVATDPLSVDEHALHDIETEVATLHRSVVAAVELTAHLDERAAELAVQIARLRRDAAAVRATVDHAARRVVGVSTAMPDVDVGALECELADTVCAAGSISWREMADRIDSLTAAVRSHSEELDARHAEARSAIQDRNDLRGLLESFRAMATRRGVIESTAVVEADRIAFDMLYEAPTDLAAASARVQAVRSAIESAVGEPSEVT